MTIFIIERQTDVQPLWTAGTLLRLPRLWLERRAWRKELADLDTEQMRDCGFNPLDVGREAAKPFWRA
jgi:uncharacterized protein YjiS (DUF1127 family)